MIEERIICNECGKETDTYLHIKEAVLRRNTGRSINKVMGYSDQIIKDKHFCSLMCIADYVRYAKTKGYTDLWLLKDTAE